MLFENIEEEKNKDQKLSDLEKTVILGLTTIAKIVLWKVKQAKTYGDLMKLATFMENKVDSIEGKYSKEEMKDKATVDLAMYEIQETEKKIKEL